MNRHGNGPRHAQPATCGMLWASVFLLASTVIAGGIAVGVLAKVSEWVVR